MNKMKIDFTLEEEFAIYKVAKMMAEADGVVLHKELEGIAECMASLGLTGEAYDKVVVSGEKMATIEALSRIEKMGEEKKKFVSSFLGNLIAIDGDVADVEMALWAFIIKAADLPKMNIRQAVDIFKRY
ncbi:MAG TPA: hypothetical protein DDX40_07505 [Rikenellaceae bacterium]|nr:hypothetical protein [Rikenellaceae bacterium]